MARVPFKDEEEDDDWISAVPVTKHVEQKEAPKKKSNEWAYDDKYFKHHKPDTTPPVFEPGDIVCFTKYFLKSIGAGETNAMWKQTGRVIERPDTVLWKMMVNVEWDDGHVSLVNACNLARASGNRDARRRVE